MMKCLFYSHPQPRDSGDYLHRVVWPGRALAHYMPVDAIQSSHPDQQQRLCSADIVVITMVADPGLLAIIDYRRRQGLCTLYEISDDFCAFPATLPMHGFYSQASVQETIKQLASACDAIQFSSVALQQKYCNLNPHHTVLMNQCEQLPPLGTPTHPRPVLGWSGSIGHLQDGLQLARILKHWARRNEVDIAIMAAAQIQQCFLDAGLNIRPIPTGSMNDYLGFLDTLDIGIASIEDNDFNRARSDGKFLEYASHGVVAICSDIDTYRHSVIHGQTGFLFSDETTLLTTLNTLLDEPALRQKIRRQAYKHIANQRTHRSNALTRYQFYLECAGSEPPPPASATSVHEYHELVHPIEARLLQALNLHQQGALHQALAIYTEVIQSAPAFHLIWQRLGQLLIAMGNEADGKACLATARQLDISARPGADNPAR